MVKFVNIKNAKYRPGKKYGRVIGKIIEDGVCPFCPENIRKYHKNPILKEGKYWLLTKNFYPYEGAKYHLLIIHKRHIEKFNEISRDAWQELKTLISGFLKKKNIPGGTFFIRFGDTAYTGASVSHLHANLVSPEGKDRNRRPIITRIG